MNLPKNPFKAALREGKQQIGIWCSIPHPSVAEAVASCGFDWMLIDTEHTVTDLPTVQTMMQAAAAYPTHVIVRPGWNDAVEIKRLLDAGAQSLLIPYVQTAAEAEKAVAAVRYPPQGMRGMAGLTRANHFGLVTDYATTANAEICLLVQVESVSALAEIEAIAAVDGVDGIFIGPADLAASMGYPGQPGHPEVKATVLEAIARIQAAGKPAGIITLDKAMQQDIADAGTTFVAVDIDLSVLVRTARGLAADWKSRA